MPLDTPPVFLKQPSVAYVRYLVADSQLISKSFSGTAKQPHIGHGGIPGTDFVSQRKLSLSRDEFKFLPLQSMKLPASGLWTMPNWQAPYESRYRLELCPNGDQSTVLTFACEGVPYSTGPQLQEILSRPTHRPSLKEKELLDPKIGDDVFASTEILNGKHVLCSEFENEGKEVYSIWFNHNPDGTQPMFLAMIVFEAKPKQYAKEIGQIKECLKTIIWLDKVDIVPSSGAK
jgi:hypothetical protein